MIIRVHNYTHVYRKDGFYRIQFIDDIIIDIPIEGNNPGLDRLYDFSKLPVKPRLRSIVISSEKHKLIPDDDT